MQGTDNSGKRAFEERLKERNQSLEIYMSNHSGMCPVSELSVEKVGGIRVYDSLMISDRGNGVGSMSLFSYLDSLSILLLRNILC